MLWPHNWADTSDTGHSEDSDISGGLLTCSAYLAGFLDIVVTVGLPKPNPQVLLVLVGAKRVRTQRGRNLATYSDCTVQFLPKTKVYGWFHQDLLIGIQKDYSNPLEKFICLARAT